MSGSQFGFRPKFGIQDIFFALHHEWIQILNKGGCVRNLAVDIAGAFDKVSHRGLLEKAEAYGLKGSFLIWLRAYLADRNITAVVGGHSSSMYSISAGVPQGSVLSPALFLLYVNDLEDHLPSGVKLAVYADDTTFYVALGSPSTLDTACNLSQSAVDVLSI